MKDLGQCFSNLNVYTSPLGIIKMQNSDSFGLGRDMWFCISRDLETRIFTVFLKRAYRSLTKVSWAYSCVCDGDKVQEYWPSRLSTNRAVVLKTRPYLHVGAWNSPAYGTAPSSMIFWWWSGDLSLKLCHFSEVTSQWPVLIACIRAPGLSVP